MTLDEFKKDYDWRCCFHEAIKGCYGSDTPGPIDEVEEIIALSEGEHDGRSWLAVVKMNDGRYAKVFAGCDYTGWD